MLRITKQADYGIVLMTHMAGDPDSRFTAPGLAAKTRLPAPTVSKILKQLGREGLLESRRGAKGGYSLAQDPGQISIAAMISALDGPIAITECLDDVPGSCSQEPICRLRGNWQRINVAIRQALEAITLAELSEPNADFLLQPALVQLGSAENLENAGSNSSAP